MEKLKSYRWPIMVIVVGLASFVAAISYDDLRSTKVDIMGLITTGYGVAECMIRRSRKHAKEELQATTEGQTSLLLVSIGEGLSQLKTELRSKHEQNQRLIKALFRKFKRLSETTENRLMEIDKHLERRDVVLAEHRSRLEALEQGQRDVVKEVHGNSARLEKVMHAMKINGITDHLPIDEKPAS